MKKKLILSLFVLLATSLTFAQTITYTDFDESEYKSIESIYYIEEDSAITKTTKYFVVTKLMDYEVDSSGRQIVSVLTEDLDLYPLVHRGDQLPNQFGIDRNAVEVFIHVESNNFETIFVIDAIRLLDHKFLFNVPYTAKENLYLREGGSRNDAKIMLMKAGSSVYITEVGEKETIDGITSNWVKIMLAESDGSTIEGWCFGGYLKVNL